jgi:cell shape-determining protein MreD
MIVRQLASASVIYLSLVLQPNLDEVMGQTMFRPWMPGMALVVCAWLTNGTSYLIWSALIGLTIDCLSEGRLGIHMLSATAAAVLLLAFQFSRRRNILIIGALTFVSNFAWHAFAVITEACLSHSPIQIERYTTLVISESVATTVVLLGTLIVGRAAARALGPYSTSSVALSNQWSMLSDG